MMHTFAGIERNDVHISPTSSFAGDLKHEGDIQSKVKLSLYETDVGLQIGLAYNHKVRDKILAKVLLYKTKETLGDSDTKEFVQFFAKYDDVGLIVIDICVWDDFTVVLFQNCLKFYSNQNADTIKFNEISSLTNKKFQKLKMYGNKQQFLLWLLSDSATLLKGKFFDNRLFINLTVQVDITLSCASRDIYDLMWMQYTTDHPGGILGKLVLFGLASEHPRPVETQSKCEISYTHGVVACIHPIEHVEMCAVISSNCVKIVTLPELSLKYQLNILQTHMIENASWLTISDVDPFTDVLITSHYVVTYTQSTTFIHIYCLGNEEDLEIGHGVASIKTGVSGRLLLSKVLTQEKDHSINKTAKLQLVFLTYDGFVTVNYKTIIKLDLQSLLPGWVRELTHVLAIPGGSHQDDLENFATNICELKPNILAKRYVEYICYLETVSPYNLVKFFEILEKLETVSAVYPYFSDLLKKLRLFTICDQLTTSEIASSLSGQQISDHIDLDDTEDHILSLLSLCLDKEDGSYPVTARIHITHPQFLNYINDGDLKDYTNLSRESIAMLLFHGISHGLLDIMSWSEVMRQSGIIDILSVDGMKHLYLEYVMKHDPVIPIAVKIVNFYQVNEALKLLISKDSFTITVSDIADCLRVYRDGDQGSVLINIYLLSLVLKSAYSQKSSLGDGLTSDIVSEVDSDDWENIPIDLFDWSISAQNLQEVVLFHLFLHQTEKELRKDSASNFIEAFIECEDVATDKLRHTLNIPAMCIKIWRDRGYSPQEVDGLLLRSCTQSDPYHLQDVYSSLGKHCAAVANVDLMRSITLSEYIEDLKKSERITSTLRHWFEIHSKLLYSEIKKCLLIAVWNEAFFAMLMPIVCQGDRCVCESCDRVSCPVLTELLKTMSDSLTSMSTMLSTSEDIKKEEFSTYRQHLPSSLLKWWNCNPNSTLISLLDELLTVIGLILKYSLKPFRVIDLFGDTEQSIIRSLDWAQAPTNRTSMKSVVLDKFRENFFRQVLSHFASSLPDAFVDAIKDIQGDVENCFELAHHWDLNTDQLYVFYIAECYRCGNDDFAQELISCVMNKEELAEQMFVIAGLRLKQSPVNIDPSVSNWTCPQEIVLQAENSSLESIQLMLEQLSIMLPPGHNHWNLVSRWLDAINYFTRLQAHN